MAHLGATRFGLSALLGLICLSSHADEITRPSVSILRQDAQFQVSAALFLPVSPCVVYEVLTDYEHLPDFIPGMLKTRVKRTAINQVNVWQLAEVQVLFFHVKMESTLDMEEVPNQRISFKQTAGDLKFYRGEWQLLNTLDGTQLRYDAQLEFKQFMPLFLARAVLENELEKRFIAIAQHALNKKYKFQSACEAE